MPKRSSKADKDDVNVIAHRILLEATGEAEPTDHVWELADLIALMPKPVARPWGSVKRAASA
jgi:hypothetical protein